MSYWQLFYHCIWTTKNRQPFITPTIEPALFGFMQSKAIALGGTVFTLNGTADHVHLVVSIPPTQAISQFVGQIKGASSFQINRTNLLSEPFQWQEEYGVFSFDGKRLPNYVDYVEKQKAHHASHNLLPILERTSSGQVRMVREPTAVYITQSSDWWQEMALLAEHE